LLRLPTDTLKKQLCDSHFAGQSLLKKSFGENPCSEFSLPVSMLTRRDDDFGCEKILKCAIEVGLLRPAGEIAALTGLKSGIFPDLMAGLKIALLSPPCLAPTSPNLAVFPDFASL